MNSKRLNKLDGVAPESFFVTIFLFVALLFLGGCSTAAAQRSMEQIRKSAENGRTQKNAEILRLIDEIALRDHATADENADAALASVTKPDGTVNAATSVAIQNKRIKDYAAIERYCTILKQRVIDSDIDFQNINAYVDGMQGYFQNRQSAADTINAASEGGLKIFDALLARRGAKIPEPK